ncbi:MAG TPA: flagellar motor switch protein FliM, partial [Rhodospirillaceae bacterium]|nr:flagellar motor switch protein FliM [Rhodospirillaceae bacterium]
MTSPADDQDAMAAEWEAAMGGDGEGGGEGGDGDEQDELAAEWEAMMGGDGDGASTDVGMAAPEATRVLNQDEIDSLLGFDDSHEEGTEKSGIQAILSSAL